MIHNDDARRRFSRLPKTIRTKVLERRPDRAIKQKTAVRRGGARHAANGVKAVDDVVAVMLTSSPVTTVLACCIASMLPAAAQYDTSIIIK